MSKYYRANRHNSLYHPNQMFPYRLSRSKIDLFINCPRCFYLDRRLGVPQPSGYPFTLNSAVDKLLKKEFDIHRAAKSAHPLMKAYGVDAIPLADKHINEWRDSLRGGISYLHEKTNLLITGGIDDIWVNPAGELYVVDYKATSKEEEVTIDADWQKGYKRQMEIYQWLFRKNGYRVSPTSYFVYANGDTDKKAFDGKLEFKVKIISYRGNDAWVEKTILDIFKCLNDNRLPPPGQECDFCRYRNAAAEVEK